MQAPARNTCPDSYHIFRLERVKGITHGNQPID